jgi:hypothetical protein
MVDAQLDREVHPAPPPLPPLATAGLG